MHRALRRLAVALAVAAPAVPVATAHAARGFLGGVNIPGLHDSAVPSDADHEIAVAEQLHARIVRVDLAWSVLEPTGPALDAHALAFTDRLISDAEAAGIKVVATIASTPCWASSAPGALRHECSGKHADEAGSWPPSDDATYAALLSALAQRYGSRLSAIEVWNEPDQANEQYFAGPEKAVKYARLLRAAYPAVKAAAPGITVLGGSLVGSNGTFLKALYAAGIKGYYDGLSVHYYNLTLGSLRSIREAQTANGDFKPLWLDEFGWTSCWPAHRTEEEQACVTSSVQARNLRDSLREMARAPYVAAATVYKLQDSPAESFGAITATGARKPAFKALEEAFDRPAGRFSAVTVKLRRRGSQVLATGTGPVGDFMVLEVSQGSRLRFRALFTESRFNTFSVALPPVLGTRGLRVSVFQYWTGAGSAAHASI